MVFTIIGSDGQVLSEVLNNPSSICNWDLLQGEGAPGIDVCEDAEAEVHALEEVSFQPDKMVRPGIDPTAAFESGQGLRDHVGRIPLWIGA